MAKTKVTFESALQELESLAQQLENQEQNLSLDDAIQAYERSQQLIQFCTTQLQAAQHKVAILSDLMPDLQPQEMES